MRKIVVLLAILSILASGCSTGKSDKETEASGQPVETPLKEGTLLTETREGDFVLQLETEKAIYGSDEPVRLVARLKYDGPLDEVTIGHAASPISFPMKETTRNINLPYPMPMPLIRTTLKQGEWFEEAYSKAGGYGENDPDKEFMKQFLQGKAFPAGSYTVSASADFELYDGEPDQPGTTDIRFGFATKLLRIEVK